MADSNLKLVVQGLPFSTNAEEVIEYFGIRKDQLSLPVWQDSGRCKGIAFLTCDSLSEREAIEEREGEDFTAASDGSMRQITIREFEERPPRRGAQRGRGSRNRNSGRGPSRESSFVSNEETQREIYVSNVSFDSTREDLMDFFKDCGVVEEVTIPTQYMTGRSKGFAFVRFETTDGRYKALDKDGMVLDGRELGIRENKGRAGSGRGRSGGSAPRRNTGLSEKPVGCTTIWVGNLPWATDEDDLRDHFSDCGEIEDTRIPRQRDTNRSRGFGYVKFKEESAVNIAVKKRLTIESRDIRIDYAENTIM